MDDKFVQYQQLMTIEMRPYEEGEDMAGIYVPEGTSPQEGDMIARDPQDRDSMWLVTKAMAVGYREANAPANPRPERRREEF